MSEQPGGGSGVNRGPQFIRRGIKLPYTDLGLTDRSDSPMELAREFGLSLVLPYGIGPNEPRLLAVDDSGRLILSQVAGSQGLVTITDDPVISNSKVRVQNDGDAIGSAVSLFTLAKGQVWNGAAWDRLRGASAAAIAAQSGIGAQLVAPPGLWSVVSNPAAGVQATATRAAGAAGVRHVAFGIVITWGAIAAPVATALTWALRDGATGAGTILAQGQLAVPGVAFQGPPVVLQPLSIPGTAATAMTLEFSAALAALLEGVTLLGFDAS